MAGIIYVLKNSAMPGLVKIGKTTRDDPKVRMAELYSTGVPVPFECVKAVMVKDQDDAEKKIQQVFSRNRINSQREFYEIDEFQATALLDLIGTKDVTPEVKKEGEETIDQQSRDAAKLLASRRPSMNFEEMSIPVGSILYALDSEDTAEVSGPRKVIFRGDEMSLTSATKIMLELEYQPRPGPYWRFEGKLISEIYDTTYGAD